MLHPRNQPQANNGVHEHPLFAVTERLKVPPRNRTRLLALALENAAISLGTEPGCYQYHVCADPELPDIVLLYGLFLDRDAFETHVASDHWQVVPPELGRTRRAARDSHVLRGLALSASLVSDIASRAIPARRRNFISFFHFIRLTPEIPLPGLRQREFEWIGENPTVPARLHLSHPPRRPANSPGPPQEGPAPSFPPPSRAKAFRSRHGRQPPIPPLGRPPEIPISGHGNRFH